MQVFISWSGEPSGTFARALAEWLPMIIQSIKPFLSSNDIRSGQRWFSEIGKQLQDTKFGILCLTPSNKEAPWMLFEAGAISKVVQESRVVPLLLGMEKSQLTLPLSQFQAISASKDDIRKLVEDMNRMSEGPLSEKRLSGSFEAFWSELQKAISGAEGEIAKPGAEVKRRTTDEMVEEILATVRSLGVGLDQMRLNQAVYGNPPYLVYPASNVVVPSGSITVGSGTVVGQPLGILSQMAREIEQDNDRRAQAAAKPEQESPPSKKK